jgi:hypothetical protein
MKKDKTRRKLKAIPNNTGRINFHENYYRNSEIQFLEI